MNISKLDQKKVKLFILNHVTEIVLAIVVIALWIAAPHFMTWRNWMNLLRSGAVWIATLNSLLPMAMSFFTLWFQKWYPAYVARGK